MKTDEEKGKYDVDKRRVENAALRKYAIIQKEAEDKIGCQKIYIDITRDIEAAFVLDEIVFFTLPKNGKSSLRVWKDGYLWLAVQRADWWDRKRLTERQADTAIKKLVEMSLVIKSVYKFNGQTTSHLRLNVTEFFKRYGVEIDKNNPPEDESDTLTRDINDLYEMMGISELQNGDSQNGETESPKCETELQNGDSINSPHHPPHNPLANTPKIVLAADRTMDALLDAERRFVQAQTDGKAWKLRDNFQHNETILMFADLCFQKFGQPSKRDISLWLLEIGDWVDRGFRPSDWKRACEITDKYDIPPAKPTSMTSALNTAAQERRNKPKEPERPEHKPYQPKEGNYVPRPAHLKPNIAG